VADAFGAFAAALHALPLDLLTPARAAAWRAPAYYAERHPSRREVLGRVLGPAMMA
jgi:hypothetical protein